MRNGRTLSKINLLATIGLGLELMFFPGELWFRVPVVVFFGLNAYITMDDLGWLSIPSPKDTLDV